MYLIPIVNMIFWQIETIDDRKDQCQIILLISAVQNILYFEKSRPTNHFIRVKMNNLDDINCRTFRNYCVHNLLLQSLQNEHKWEINYCNIRKLCIYYAIYVIIRKGGKMILCSICIKKNKFIKKLSFILQDKRKPSILN